MWRDVVATPALLLHLSSSAKEKELTANPLTLTWEGKLKISQNTDSIRPWGAMEQPTHIEASLKKFNRDHLHIDPQSNISVWFLVSRDLRLKE